MGEESNVRYIQSDHGMQDSTFLQYRLDTTDLIRQIEQTLTGLLVQFSVDPEKNAIIKTEHRVSEPLVNDKGTASIMNYVRGKINNQVVQGNLSEEFYKEITAGIREDFSMILMINLYKWDISVHHFGYIVDSVMDVIKLFLTRTIQNKERESYSSIRESTQVTSQLPKGWGVK